MSKARQLADLGNQIDDGAITGSNMVVNGAMTVAQRGTIASSVTGSAYHCCDRFYTVANALGTWTVSQASDGPSGFSNSLKYECTTADASPAAADYFVLQTRMEGQNLQQIAKGTSDAKPIVLSFWVKSNVTGTYALYLRDIDNNRGVGANYTVSSSGTWEYKTVIIPADTTGTLDNNNDLSFSLEWWLGSGTDYSSGTMPTTWGTENTVDRNAGSTVNVGDTIGNTWQITGVCLNVGDSAIAFPHDESYGETLAKCQRYYYQIGDGTGFGSAESGSGANTYLWAYPFRHPLPMRAAPSLTLISGGSTYFVGGIGVTIGTPTGDLGTVNTSSMNIATSNKTNVAVHRLGLNGFSFTRGMGYGGTSGFIHCDAEL